MDLAKKPQKTTDYHAKSTEIESKILSISGLTTSCALTAFKNKRPDINNLVKKTDYDGEILDIKSKYFTTADYNRITYEKLDIKIKQKNNR